MARLTKPLRLQLSRRKGFDLQAHSRAVNGLPAVNVGRGPGRLWGNPYMVGMCDPDIRGRNRVMVSADCIVKAFCGYALRCLEHNPDCFASLRGKNLACWCKLCAAHESGKPLGIICTDCAPCHSDPLLELANGAHADG